MKSVSMHFLFLLCTALPCVGFCHLEHEGMPWPPDPVGITNVIVHSDAVQQFSINRVESSGIDLLDNKAQQDVRVKRALGKKYSRVGLIQKEDKKNGSTVNQLVFFSQDKNTTVEVEFVNGNIRSVNSIPARIYQPEITDEEATQAQELARNYFLNQGNSKVADLKAYSILAYKPQGAGFYDSRVIYVSFHDNDDSPPEFVAWVDLTHQRILNAREEKQ